MSSQINARLRINRTISAHVTAKASGAPPGNVKRPGGKPRVAPLDAPSTRQAAVDGAKARERYTVPMSTHAEHHEQDPIEREEFFEIEQPDDGFARARLFAFNTFVALDVYGDNVVCRDALSAARDACRAYERLFSRTLPHSDIARVNNARGEATEVDPRTFDLLERALHYCSESEGVFDVTIGPLVRLWDFKRGVVADENALAEAAPHVDWRCVELFREGGSCFVRMRDPLAALDAGGIAKGWIADELSDLLADCGLGGSIVNLGGNVMVRGKKPTGEAWRVGIRDPKNPGNLLGAVSLREGSAVTSGTYERSFRKDGALYHHVLDPRTGMPVDTDVAGVTVVARRSIDAEGFSTTLLALGMERGPAFAREHDEIIQAFFVDADGAITCAR